MLQYTAFIAIISNTQFVISNTQFVIILQIKSSLWKHDVFKNIFGKLNAQMKAALKSLQYSQYVILY